MRILREGERGEAICRKCLARLPIRYEYRTVPLEESEVEVDNVLVGVCLSCDEVATIPAQSTPRLKEARERKLDPYNFRVPRHLDDVLVLIADRFSASPSSFWPIMLRFYLRELQENEEFARRIRVLARTELAKGRAEARLSIRLSEELLQAAWERAREAGIRTRTEMVKGLIVAAKEDILEGRAKARRRTLGAIASTV
ncbi:MAG: hypothetical protein ACE5JI_11625 [Acidobacteriota bacterium]